jgi:serine/threonine protein kinase
LFVAKKWHVSPLLIQGIFMTVCSSDKKLTRLLADELTETESNAIARHIESCDVCQHRLACLSADDQVMLRFKSAQTRESEDEEKAIDRLKQVHTVLANTVFERHPAAPETTPPSIPGYVILSEIGRGGMGIVYEARHLGLQRTVALKMIRAGTQAGPKELARFRTEAAMIARLQHPNIVQIHDVGESAGRPYFVLEFVAGGSLAQHLNGRPQQVRSAAQFAETLARAVHSAHIAGVVHRDLKPGNILLQGPPSTVGDFSLASPWMTPKITDFGVAKCVSGDESEHSAPTVTEEILGTPSYMAPEQASLPRQAVGPTTDIYALGAILYELLTGRAPFAGPTPLATVFQVIHSEPVAPSSLQPNLPRDLETICLKCLRKDPQKRYASALELADDLQRFLRDEPIVARPDSTLEKCWRWIRHHPLPAGLLTAGILAPIVALIAMSLLSTRLVRTIALESAAQQAELLEEATKEFSRNVQRVTDAKYVVNKTVPPTPDTVPLSIPATFLHDVGEQLAQVSKTGVQVRQYSDEPFPWRIDGGPKDQFERMALARLRENNGQGTVHEFTDLAGERVVRFAQARIMQPTCVECHNTHPQSRRKDWKEGDVRGVLEIIRPLDKDEARVGEALRFALLLSIAVSCLLLGGSSLVVWAERRRNKVRS